MGKLGRAACLAFVALISAGPAAGADGQLLEDETGSRFGRVAAMWDLPLDKNYEDLSDEQKATLRTAYEDMPATDDPPYPLGGVRRIVEDFHKAGSMLQLAGRFHATVRVDEHGKGTWLQIFETPDSQFNKVAAAILMNNVHYKPAVCSGKPCVMDFPVLVDFEPKPRRFN